MAWKRGFVLQERQMLLRERSEVRLVLFGGYRGDSQPLLDDTWVWDGTDWHSGQKPPSLPPWPAGAPFRGRE